MSTVGIGQDHCNRILSGYVLVRKLGKQTLKRLNTRFGHMLHIAANQTGSIRSVTYVNWLVPCALKRAADKARDLAALPKGAPILLVEDQAPGHIGDRRPNTKIVFCSFSWFLICF